MLLHLIKSNLINFSLVWQNGNTAYLVFSGTFISSKVQSLKFFKVKRQASKYCKSEKRKILFYGTDTFSLETLKVLNENRLLLRDDPQVVQQVDVVCAKANSPVAKYSVSSHLNIYKWPYDVPPGLYDVGIVVSFGHLIPRKSIIAFKYGMLNAHASLLPRWRGAAPIFHTILNGDAVTGVSIIEVAPGRFDVGKILLQKQVDVPLKATSVELGNLLAMLAAKMVLQCLLDLPCYLERSWAQPEEGRTNAPKITAEMGEIKWEHHTKDEVERLYRAVIHSIQIYTYLHGLKVKLIEIKDCEEYVDESNRNLKPGSFYFHKKRKILYIKCKTGWLGVSEIGVEGRKKMTAHDFYNGFISKLSLDLHYFG